MYGNFNSAIDLTGRIQRSNLDSGFNMSLSPLNNVDNIETKSFKGVMSDMAQGINQELNAPDQLLKDAMTGSGDVDIHDVMTAMAKAELTVNVATQITSKVIQAYDKIMQIQV